MGYMALFTHLKFILLQYFQFSIFSKISCIQTDLKHRLLLNEQTKIQRKHPPTKHEHFWQTKSLDRHTK